MKLTNKRGAILSEKMDPPFKDLKGNIRISLGKDYCLLLSREEAFGLGLALQDLIKDNI